MKHDGETYEVLGIGRRNREFFAAGSADLSIVYCRPVLGKSCQLRLPLTRPEQRATVVLPTTGRVVTVKALFSPGDVTILDGIDTWAINRVDLGISADFDDRPRSIDLHWKVHA